MTLHQINFMQRLYMTSMGLLLDTLMTHYKQLVPIRIQDCIGDRRDCIGDSMVYEEPKQCKAVQMQL